MPSNYVEYVEFVNKVGANKRQRGIRISDDLVVAYASPYSNDKNRFRIFSIVSGRPVINLDFYDKKDAEKFAKILDKVYKDYWFLLSEYPKMSIPQVCMWSVENGIRTFVALSSLEDQDTITLTDLKNAYEAAKDKVNDYMKFPQKG